jgi:hypothetical protein
MLCKSKKKLHLDADVTNRPLTAQMTAAVSQGFRMFRSKAICAAAAATVVFGMSTDTMAKQSQAQLTAMATSACEAALLSGDLAALEKVRKEFKSVVTACTARASTAGVSTSTAGSAEGSGRSARPFIQALFGGFGRNSAVPATGNATVVADGGAAGGTGAETGTGGTDSETGSGSTDDETGSGETDDGSTGGETGNTNSARNQGNRGLGNGNGGGNGTASEGNAEKNDTGASDGNNGVGNGNGGGNGTDSEGKAETTDKGASEGKAEPNGKGASESDNDTGNGNGQASEAKGGNGKNAGEKNNG